MARNGPRHYEPSLVEQLKEALQQPFEITVPERLSGREVVQQLAPYIKEQVKSGVSYEQIKERLKSVNPQFDLSVFSIREYAKVSTDTQQTKFEGSTKKKSAAKKKLAPQENGNGSATNAPKNEAPLPASAVDLSGNESQEPDESESSPKRSDQALRAGRKSY